MKTEQAVQRMTAILRRKHLALSTEQSCCAWLKRYCDCVRTLPAALPSEQKLERFLTALARQGVAASTQNQAFNAILFSTDIPRRISRNKSNYCAIPSPSPILRAVERALQRSAGVIGRVEWACLKRGAAPSPAP